MWGVSVHVVSMTPPYRALEAGEAGEVWSASASIAMGYWGHDQAMPEAFQAFLETGEGPFLRTGDLGFFHRGELFICGRLKDMMIDGGRNVHPHDIEVQAERDVEALRAGCSACFSLEPYEVSQWQSQLDGWKENERCERSQTEKGAAALSPPAARREKTAGGTGTEKVMSVAEVKTEPSPAQVAEIIRSVLGMINKHQDTAFSAVVLLRERTKFSKDVLQTSPTIEAQTGFLAESVVPVDGAIVVIEGDTFAPAPPRSAPTAPVPDTPTGCHRLDGVPLPR
jgi:acyl-CoA synthetase (AMP-forming)/AMP-acid ligase II